jgi:hypothetical protein
MFGVESAYRRIKGACNHPGLLSRTSSPKNPTGFPFFAGRASALVQSDAHGSKVGCRIRGFDGVKVCKVKVIVQNCATHRVRLSKNQSAMLSVGDYTRMST